MEADYLDLSTLKISLNDENNLDINSLTTTTENTSENTINECNKIIGISIPKDQPPFSDKGKTELPLIIHFSNRKEKRIVFPIDRYFHLVSNIWNHPDYAKEADSITMEKKMKDAAPYNLFFSTLKHAPETKEQLHSINFTDLLCPSLGKLKSSLHITFKSDLKWILSQFALRKVHTLPMTILYGHTQVGWPSKETIEQLYPNIDFHYIEVRFKETDLGCHDTKLNIFLYEDDSVRVVIGSADLDKENWEIFNQQLWISPSCPKLPDGSSTVDGESPTGFRSALLNYLSVYDQHNFRSLQEWIERIKNVDFSEVKVALLFSTPGVHYPRKNGSLLHFIGHLLTRDCTIPAPKEEHDSWRVVIQTASLGLVGRRPEEWLTTFVLKALGSHKNQPYFPTFPAKTKVKFSLIYPSVKNVLNGYLREIGALCCMYESQVKDEQRWLLKYKCQWKADETKRSRAMCYAKVYCRISPCSEKMAYYFLTSANLSRSGWGKVPDQDSKIVNRSYEMGILFLPKYFGEEYFELKDNPNRKNQRLFPMMFDLPLVPYEPEDDSYCLEELVRRGIVEKPINIHFKQELQDAPGDNVEARNITVNKWDKKASEGAQTTETKKKDMKFNLGSKRDMFFPSFSK